MTDALIWMGALLLAGLAIYAIIYENRQRAKITEEEWEAQSHERGASSLGAIAMGIDQALRPEMQKAAEVRMDQRHGMNDEGDHAGKVIDDR